MSENGKRSVLDELRDELDDHEDARPLGPRENRFVRTAMRRVEAWGMLGKVLLGLLTLTGAILGIIVPVLEYIVLKGRQ